MEDNNEMALLKEKVAQLEEKLQQTTSALNSLFALTGNDTVGSDEAARMLGVGLRTIHEYVRLGVLASFKHGNKLQFSRDEILRYKKERRRYSKREMNDAVDAWMANKKYNPGRPLSDYLPA